MDPLTSQVHQFLSSIDLQSRTLWVAYSGGMDSHVLLHLIAKQRETNSAINLAAIHINHQLQDQAGMWEEHCQKQCDDLAVPLTRIKVNVATTGKSSPEEAARDARYQGFMDTLTSEDILLTAHHERDQAETLLLQLMRGAGAAGLSAMPYCRILGDTQLYRPLLSSKYSWLEDYAERNSLSWIEDPSNNDTNLRRNFIRNEIMPAMRKTWPSADEVISQSAQHLAQDISALNWFLDNELQQVCPAPDVLNIDKLSEYPQMVQNQLVRCWYASLGLASPGEDKLALIFNEVIHARQDASPKFSWQSSVLHRIKNQLILSPDWSTYDMSGTVADSSITTPAWNLRIRLVDSPTTDSLQLIQATNEQVVKINGEERTLKRRYKEIAMPVLFRQHLPALYLGSELILVPGVYSHPEFIEQYEFDFVRMGNQPQGASRPLLSVLGID